MTDPLAYGEWLRLLRHHPGRVSGCSRTHPTGSHVTAAFPPGHGIVVEIMGLGRATRITLNRETAFRLAQQLDLAALQTTTKGIDA